MNNQEYQSPAGGLAASSPARRERALPRSLPALLSALVFGCGEPIDLDDLLDAPRPPRGHRGGDRPHVPDAGCAGTSSDGATPAGDGMSPDELFALLQADILRQDADDRPFARYVSLSSLEASSGCEALDTARRALAKLVNATSINSRIALPVAIDSRQLLYRLDLRDYGWDRPMRLDGRELSDAWEAMIAASPFAVPFEGDEADVVREASATSVAVLPLGAFVDVASRGELYLDLVDVAGSFDEFVLDDLGIDREDNLNERQMVRAGTSRSVVSRNDRLVERSSIEVRPGSLWLAFDSDGDSQGIDFTDPLALDLPGETLAIFDLPNGFNAYAVFADDGERTSESSLLFDTLQDDFVLRAGISCMGCHAAGVLPVVDDVRALVEANSDLFSDDELDAVRALYPRPDDLAELLEGDAERYAAALDRAGVSTQQSDPVSDVFLQFRADADLSAAAAELMVSPSELLVALPRLAPELRSLRGGSASRQVLARSHLDALCALHELSENRPSSEVCRRAN